MLIAEDPAMDIAPAPPPARPWPGDRAGALDALLSRRSCPPRLLSDPAPSDDHLRLMVEAAVRAPDHAGLRPWRFICIQDAARVRLGVPWPPPTCAATVRPPGTSWTASA